MPRIVEGVLGGRGPFQPALALGLTEARPPGITQVHLASSGSRTDLILTYSRRNEQALCPPKKSGTIRPSARMIDVSRSEDSGTNDETLADVAGSRTLPRALRSRELFRAVGRRAACSLCEAESDAAELAFAALVERHASMVLAPVVPSSVTNTMPRMRSRQRSSSWPPRPAACGCGNRSVPGFLRSPTECREVQGQSRSLGRHANYVLRNLPPRRFRNRTRRRSVVNRARGDRPPSRALPASALALRHAKLHAS